jgi:hypothetical protein
MINLQVSVQQVKDYIPLVSKAGSHANNPTIVNVGNGKFKVHGEQFVKDELIVWRRRAGNN